MKYPCLSKAVIDLGAYAHNLRTIRRMLPKGCGIVPVVKANAYGHGMLRIAKKAVEEDVAMLAVFSVAEGIALREDGIQTPVVVLGQPCDEGLAAALEYNLRLTISERGVAERLGELARRANKVAPVHCKIDTGMGRQGWHVDEAAAEMLYLTRISHIDIEGVCTHFAVAGSSLDPFTSHQVRLFRQLLRQLNKEGIPYEMAHAANSGAIANHPNAMFDLVRPGLMTYGIWPGDAAPVPCPLQPVLRWEALVALVKELPSGSSIGYERTFTTAGMMRTAIVPVGYADGYKYSCANRTDVLIRGQRCPVRGNISMDQIAVDVTDVPNVAPGDTATLIGRDGDETITVQELAQGARTIPYDILVGIGQRVEREYVE